MSLKLARGLLNTAECLLDEKRSAREGGACYRRAISSAYYAVVHLLFEEALARTMPTESRTRLGVACARSVSHEHVSKVSKWFKSDKDPLPEPVRSAVTGMHFPDELREFAAEVAQLRQRREEADYNFDKQITKSSARYAVDQARRAFASWNSVRETPAAEVYLTLILFGGMIKNRKREPESASARSQRRAGQAKKSTRRR